MWLEAGAYSLQREARKPGFVQLEEGKAGVTLLPCVTVLQVGVEV